jgi:hypothetical protein
VVNAFEPWARDRGDYYDLRWKVREDAENDDAFKIALNEANQDPRYFPEVERRHVGDELLVVFKTGTTPSRMDAINASLNVQILNTMVEGRVHLVRVQQGASLAQVRAAYLKFPEVEAVEFNQTIQAQ